MKKYLSPEVLVIALTTKDVITLSVASVSNDDGFTKFDYGKLEF